MSAVLNSNIFSIYAQRQSSLTQRVEQSAMDRLSSGARINHAQDDTVGWAMLHHQNAQINGHSQSLRNTNDGISLLQSADGAMDGITGVLHRMRELALQNATGTYSEVDRHYIQTEFDFLQGHILNIIDTTKFNNIAILNRPADQEQQSFELQIGGEFSSLVEKSSYQGYAVDPELKGYLTGDLVESSPGVPLTKSDEVELTTQSFPNPSGPGTITVYPSFRFNVDGVSTGTLYLDQAPMTRSVADWGAEIESKVNAALTGGESISVSYDEQKGYFVLVSDSSGAGSTIEVESADIAKLGFARSIGASQEQVISTIGTALEERSIAVDMDNQPSVNVDLPETIMPLGRWETYLEGKVSGLNVSYDSAGQRFVLSSVNGEEGTVSLMGDAVPLGLRMHDTNQVMVDHFDLDDPAHALGALLQDSQSIATAADASAMLEKIDSAISFVNEGRAHFAAVENRLLKVSQTLEGAYLAGSKARSVIKDADYAADSAEMVKSQIMRQASNAMMAQANQIPKQMLQLFN